MTEVWNADAYEAGRRCWNAALTADDDTRRSLERAATRYFWRACGMEAGRAAGLNAALPSVRDHPDSTQNRQTGGAGLRDGNVEPRSHR